MRFINEHHYGAPTMPLDVRCSEPHRDAGHNVVVGKSVEFTIVVHPDGRWEVEL